MSAKKRSARSSGKDKAGRAPPKTAATEIIELSSDSSDLSPDDDQERPNIAAAPARPAPTATTTAPGKRKSSEAEPSSSTGPDSADDLSPASKRQRKLAVRVKDVEGSAVAAAATAVTRAQPAVVVTATPAAASKGPHVRFGDNDDETHEQFFTPLEAPTTNPLDRAVPPVPSGGDGEDKDEDEEEEDDDDAPPEAVSTSAAALQTKKQAQIAAKAAEQQAAALRQKRQRRDALFKTQARKRALDAVEKEVVGGLPTGPSANGDDDEAEAESRSRIPALLPAEMLESDDDEDEDDVETKRLAAATSSSGVRRPKKIKFETAERMLAREGRRPADKRVGSTVYRVLVPQGDARLAPEQSKFMAHQKKRLLARGRVEVAAGAGRRKGGFLVRK